MRARGVVMVWWWLALGSEGPRTNRLSHDCWARAGRHCGLTIRGDTTRLHSRHRADAGDVGLHPPRVGVKCLCHHSFTAQPRD